MAKGAKRGSGPKQKPKNRPKKTSVKQVKPARKRRTRSAVVSDSEEDADPTPEPPKKRARKSKKDAAADTSSGEDGPPFFYTSAGEESDRERDERIIKRVPALTHSVGSLQTQEDLRAFCKSYRDLDFSQIEDADDAPEVKSITNIRKYIGKQPFSKEVVKRIVTAARAGSSTKSPAAALYLPRPLVTTRAEVAAAVTDLRGLIQRINGDAGSTETQEFLARLQALGDSLTSEFSICSNVVFYLDKRQRQSRHYAGMQELLQRLGLISQFTKYKAPKRIVLALAAFPTASSVEQTLEERIGTAWHCNVLVQVRGDKGKDLVVCEPNLLPKVRVDRESVDLAVLFKSWMVQLLRCKEMSDAAHKLWVNMPRPIRNSGGICLALALDWMLELVVEGFPGSRDSGGRLQLVRDHRGKPLHYRPL